MTDQASPGELSRLRDGRIEIVLDLRVYRLTAIQKAAYRLAGRFTAAIGELEGEVVTVRLTFGPAASEQDAQEATALFFRELLDQELREKIGAETAGLRALILAHAFSRSDLAPRG